MQESNSEDLKSQLEHSFESLKFALQSARMCSWEVDFASNTVSCCQEMLELWGIPQEEFTGQRSELQKKVHPDDVERMREAITRAVAEQSIYDLLYRIIPSPGNIRWVRSRGRCLYAKDSGVPIKLSGVVFDVTAERHREQFLTIASHELRTPLTSLILQLEVIQWELKEKHASTWKDTLISTSFKKLQAQTDRMTRIVHNIFENMKHEERGILLKRTSFDLATIVTDVIDRFSSFSVSHGTEIFFEKESSSISGYWDQDQIEHVLVNLLSNAIRFGNRQPVTISIGQSENFAFIKVQDQGVGIALNDCEKIFEKFSGAAIESNQSGLGIGLYLSRRIVEAHGGKLTVESTPGVKTEFKVLLPMS